MVLWFLIVGVLICIHLWIKNHYEFWNKRNIKGPTPIPILGNLASFLFQKNSLGTYYNGIYEQYQNEKLVGLYRGFKPVILVRDPELIKHILIKDFHIFQERGDGAAIGIKRKHDNSLFRAEGEEWRLLRKKITPIFTSKKLKGMVVLLQQCANRFNEYVESIIERNTHFDLGPLTPKYTFHVVGTCFFGIHINTFTEQENEIMTLSSKIFKKTNFFRQMITTLEQFIPGINIILDSEIADIQNFFLKMVRQVIQQKENESIKKNDFIDLLLELREQANVNRQSHEGEESLDMNDDLITQQIIAFFAAGYETGASTMAFMLHEIALHQDIQDKLYNEICKVFESYGGKLNYEALKEMTYLQQVFDETLRKYTVAPALYREVQTDFILPDTNIAVPKKTSFVIPIWGLHRNAKYFPNPNKFNPENFSAENKSRLPACMYIPFGDGPRNCIGYRFGMIQVKMGIAMFLKNFQVQPSERTPKELRFDPRSTTLKSIDGLWVKIIKR